MNTITKLVVLLSLCLIVSKANAQDTIQNPNKIDRVKEFNDAKERIKNEEKEVLKKEVEAINQRLENGEITKENADILKHDAAKKHALNIENRLAIIDNQIELLKRNNNKNYNYGQLNENEEGFVGIRKNGKGSFSLGFDFDDKKTPKYDIRTNNDLVFGIGFNNTLIDGQSLDDSPYKLGGSGFVELGLIWKTRVLQESNFVRFTYGVSFQWNKLSIKDNLYFVDNGDLTTLEKFPLDLKKSKFRTTSLVVPLHFEFGPSRKIETEDRLRYYTDDHFKIGIGGFAGFNLSTKQKLKYTEDGDLQKDKMKSDFNTTNIVYGLSGYVGVGDFSIYAKYNLNDLFKNQTVSQHNVSLGLRWDLD